MATTTLRTALSDTVGHATVVIPTSEESTQMSNFSVHGVISSGRIVFPDNKRTRAEYIRIRPDTSVFEVQQILNDWCGGAPSLAISITGGAKAFTMSSSLSRAFQRGLVKVARTTGAWIITGGMNKGIMESVGRIIQKNPDPAHPVHLIGVATWGCVSGHEQLDSTKSAAQYFQPDVESKGQAPLEPNHTEFIFIDDGTKGKYGGEIEFRARLEEAISGGFFGSKSPNDSPEQEINPINGASTRQKPIPVVLIVVEGGPNTVRTVHEAVVQSNIPAVFLDGTGRCCNLFAKAYRLYNEYCEKLELTKDSLSKLDQTTLSQRYDELKNRLNEKLSEDLNEIYAAEDSGKHGQSRPKTDTNAKAKKCFELVYECIHTRHNFLNIIAFDPRNPIEPDIDLAILRALLNALSDKNTGKTPVQLKLEQLRLALEWNRVDIAERHIMKNERNWEKIISNELFALALSRNQTAFIQLFLDHRFSLLNLFRDHDPKVKVIVDELNRQGQKNMELLSEFDDSSRTFFVEKIKPLIGDFFEVNGVIEILQINFPVNFKNLPEKNMNQESNRPPNNEKDIDKEFFLWSLVTGRHDFAMLFWSRGGNKVAGALVATLIFKKLADIEKETIHSQKAMEFETLAVEILDKFYEANEGICSDAIVRGIRGYSNITWLELAVAAEAKEFIAHRAVQDALNNIWFGFIDQSVSDTTILFSTVALWYSGFLPYNAELVEQTESDSTTVNPNQFTLSKLRYESDHKKPSNREIDPIQETLLENTDETHPKFAGDAHRRSDQKNKPSSGILRYFSNVLLFMHAPYVKFLYNLYFHTIFLLLFSYMLLCDFFPLYEFSGSCSATAEANENRGSSPSGNSDDRDSSHAMGLSLMVSESGVPYGMQKKPRPSISEIILVLWVISLVVEEIRQLVTIETQSIKNAIVEYFEVFWNQLDILAIVLFFVGFTLRFINSNNCFCAARIVLSIDLTIWYLRSLDIFAAVKRLGPKLTMIGEMVHDLKYFMILLAVFILSFGVSAHSLVNGTEPFSWHLPRRILNLGYWPIFGELKVLETFDQSYQAFGYTGFILFAIYMTIVSILLVNLLIAVFTFIFERVQTDTDRIWKFQRYSLVCEYLSRPVLPPPLIIFVHFWRLSFFLLSRCSKSKWLRMKYDTYTNRTKYRKILGDQERRYIKSREDVAADEVYFNYLKTGRKLADENDFEEERDQSPQENMLNKIRNLETRVQTMSKEQSEMFESLTKSMTNLEFMLKACMRPLGIQSVPRDDSLDEPLYEYNNQSQSSIRLEPTTDSLVIALKQRDDQIEAENVDSSLIYPKATTTDNIDV